ncbi:hypothetical protein, partial [Paracoccus rhizosphaerae]
MKTLSERIAALSGRFFVRAVQSEIICRASGRPRVASPLLNMPSNFSAARSVLSHEFCQSAVSRCGGMTMPQAPQIA